MKTTLFIDYPVLQIRPNCLLVYGRREWLISTNRKKNTKLLANLKAAKTYTGKTTKLNVKRMKRCINTLIAQARWKTAEDYKTGRQYKFLINFITLTLPCPQGNVPDKVIKKECLDVWLKSAKRIFKIGSYFWRAERQLNGNLHFHLITDTFIPYDKLCSSWNARLERLGFISEFEKNNGHRFPNSTDVHAVKHVNDLASYIIKYCTKDFVTKKDIEMITQTRFRSGSKPQIKALKRLNEILNLSDVPINGKIWDCSTNIKKAKRCEILLESDAAKIWREELNSRPDKATHKDHCSFIVYSRPEFLAMLRGTLKTEYDNWCEAIRKQAA